MEPDLVKLRGRLLGVVAICGGFLDVLTHVGRGELGVDIDTDSVISLAELGVSCHGEVKWHAFDI